MNSTARTQFLKTLNYLRVQNCDEPIHTQQDAYLSVRSCLVLGNIDLAEIRFCTLAPEWREDEFFRSFLEIQLDIYRRINLRESSRRLAALKKLLPPSLFFEGELAFAQGYLLNLLDEYATSVRYHRTAADSYRAAGFFGAEAHALFNLCVAYNHLNERSQFETVFAQLSRVAEKEKYDGVHLPWKRMEAYRLVDREEYEKAWEILLPLAEICRANGRIPDLGAIACLSAFLASKLGRLEEFDRHFAGINQQGWLPNHRVVLKAYDRLRDVGPMDWTMVNRMFCGWKKRKIDLVNFLFLLNIVADKLLNARNYDSLERIALLGSQLALRGQQALSLVDFRYYEIFALARSGLVEQAARLLSMYEQDAREDQSVIRERRAKILAKTLNLIDRESPISTAAVKLTLNSVLHYAILDGKKIDLLRKPLVEKLLALLIARGPWISIYDAFREVYQMDYDPVWHERRLHSLVDRARKILGKSDLLIRREKQIGISSRVQTVLEKAKVSGDLIMRRRDELVRFLMHSKVPLPISKIEKHFRCSRRTLQADLKDLAKLQVIHVQGGTRNRKYFRTEKIIH